MISGYYQDKSILITGTTGFVGKVILEKILRTFPDVRAIYISIKVRKINLTEILYFKSRPKMGQVVKYMTATKRRLKTLRSSTLSR